MCTSIHLCYQGVNPKMKYTYIAQSHMRPSTISISSRTPSPPPPHFLNLFNHETHASFWEGSSRTCCRFRIYKWHRFDAGHACAVYNSHNSAHHRPRWRLRLLSICSIWWCRTHTRLLGPLTHHFVLNHHEGECMNVWRRSNVCNLKIRRFW